ncbi:hypothetical protein DP20_3049 [Shigella flexneri]|nr:hypothetical protein DP20_3049 [Shigella flexneri]
MKLKQISVGTLALIPSNSHMGNLHNSGSAWTPAKIDLRIFRSDAA